MDSFAIIEMQWCIVLCWVTNYYKHYTCYVWMKLFCTWVFSSASSFLASAIYENFLNAWRFFSTSLHPHEQLQMGLKHMQVMSITCTIAKKKFQISLENLKYILLMIRNENCFWMFVALKNKKHNFRDRDKELYNCFRCRGGHLAFWHFDLYRILFGYIKIQGVWWWLKHILHS